MTAHALATTTATPEFDTTPESGTTPGIVGAAEPDTTSDVMETAPPDVKGVGSPMASAEVVGCRAGYMPTVRGRDGVLRPAWADRTEEARAYFDTEWGAPVRSEAGLFELVVLFVFAGGLTWSGVLARRAALSTAFAGFDVDAVAAFDDHDVDRLLGDASMIRNESKIRAALACARATVGLREDGGLVDLVWSAVEDEELPPATDLTSLPRSDDRAARLAAAMRAVGFERIGPVAAHSLLLAAGVVPVRRDPAPRPWVAAADRKSDTDSREGLADSRPT